MKITYALDNKDDIISVGGDWERFSSSNHYFTPIDQIIGKSIWAFVQGADVRQFYRAFFAKARAGQFVDFDYRCDSPEVKRIFRMNICQDSEVSQRLTLESTLVSEATQTTPCIQFKNDSILRACCVCNCIFYNNDWLEVEEFVRRTGFMLAKQSIIGVTHTYCTSCYAKAMAVLNSPSFTVARK